VHEDPGVRQGEPLPGRAGAEEELPIDAASPTQIVLTSQLTYCMVS